MNSYVEVRMQGKIKKIWLNQVKFFMSNIRLIEAHMINGELLSFYGKLSDLEKKIDGAGFMRCHSSYLVNRYYVEQITRRKIILCGEHIPVSRRYYSKMRDDGLVGIGHKRIESSAMPMQPVGILVNTKGEHVGNINNLYAGNNYVVLTKERCIVANYQQNDWEPSISITYRYDENCFVISSLDEETEVYVDHEPLSGSQYLKNCNSIQLGEIEFLFVPICTEAFQW